MLIFIVIVIGSLLFLGKYWLIGAGIGVIFSIIFHIKSSKEDVATKKKLEEMRLEYARNSKNESSSQN